MVALAYGGKGRSVRREPWGLGQSGDGAVSAWPETAAEDSRVDEEAEGPAMEETVQDDIAHEHAVRRYAAEALQWALDRRDNGGSVEGADGGHRAA